MQVYQFCPASSASFLHSITVRRLVSFERARADEARRKATPKARARARGFGKSLPCANYRTNKSILLSYTLTRLYLFLRRGRLWVGAWSVHFRDALKPRNRELVVTLPPVQCPRCLPCEFRAASPKHGCVTNNPPSIRIPVTCASRSDFVRVVPCARHALVTMQTEIRVFWNYQRYGSLVAVVAVVLSLY